MRTTAGNAAPTRQDQNLITHVRGITFGLQTTTLNGNCRLPKLAIAIGPLFRLRIGILGNCAHRSRECEVRMRHDSPFMVADISVPRGGEIVFASLSIKLFKYRPD